MFKKTKEAFTLTIPIMMGYVVLGIAFSLLLRSKGYPIYYAMLMSVFIYAGSMQFVAINLLTSGASLISSAIMTLLINARHVVYGLSMINRYKDMGVLKPYMIFSLTDETYSLIVSNKSDDKILLFLISFFDQCYWVLGTLIGAYLSDMIKINTKGLDFAMTALFIVIVVEQYLTNDKHVYNNIGFLLSILCLIIFKPSSFIIPSIICILITLIVMYMKGDRYES